MRAAALFGPAILGPLIDAACTAASRVESARHRTARLLRKLRLVRRAANLIADESALPRDVRFSHVPVDWFLRILARVSTEKNLKRYARIARHVGTLLNPSRVPAAEFRWLLSQGGEKEPRRVVEQFARWIRNDEMKCYRTEYDYKAHYAKIRVPLAVIFGDLDKIASPKSTSSINRRVRSAYFVWRPVKDNSHLELTMGYDLAQICEDVRDLVEYAAARERARSSA
jgi:pimeloyl-ACP methyl ester carboxylesterase